MMKSRARGGDRGDAGATPLTSSFTPLPLTCRTHRAEVEEEEDRGRYLWASVGEHRGIFHLCYVLFIPLPEDMLVTVLHPFYSLCQHPERL